MYSTALPVSLPPLSENESSALLRDVSLMSLYEVFAVVPDPRSRHGLRYELPYLLVCLVAALLCTCNSLEAVGQWCRDQEVLLQRIFGERDFYTPTGSLYRRLLPRLSVTHLEVALCTWLQASRRIQDDEPIALDGKTVRGARVEGKTTPHLLSFCTHQSQETLLQVRVGEKTNEIPVAQAFLPCLRSHCRVYTADALHTHAAFMQGVHVCRGACVLTVKGNQPTLYADLATYFNDPTTSIASWEQEATLDRQRGRVEERRIKVSCGLNDYLRSTWPHLGQVAQLTRIVTTRRTNTTTQETVYLITDLSPIQASPCRLLDLIRGHWSIENRLHYVRDVSFREDGSRLRSGDVPQLMAAFRNLAITLIHRSGSSHIAASRRHFASRPQHAFDLLLSRVS